MRTAGIRKICEAQILREPHWTTIPYAKTEDTMKNVTPRIGIMEDPVTDKSAGSAPEKAAPVKAGLTILLCLLFTGCALQTDIRQIEERLAAAERRNVSLQKELRVLKGDMRRFDQSAEDKNRSLRDQSADLQVMADKLRNEIRALTGRLEEADYGFNKRLNTLERGYRGLSSPSRALPGSGTGPDGRDRPLNSPLMPDAGGGLDPAALYKAAKTDFDAGQYKAARAGFEAVLTAAPKSVYAGNAHFWLGQIHYQRKEFGKAILEYQEVVDNYPESGKLPVALLKQGYAFVNLQDRKNARMMFDLLVQKYPGTAEAKAAREQLSRMK